MTDRVIIKGWRGREEEFRAELRDRLWTDAEVVSLRYDDQRGFRGPALRFDVELQEQVKRERYRAEWQRRKDDPAYRERQRMAHAAWRQKNREHVRAYAAAQAKAHPEVGRAKQARARARNPHRSAIYMQLMRLAGVDW